MGVWLRGAGSLGLAGALALAVAWSTATANTEGKTTVEQTIAPLGEGPFSPLALAAGEPYLERGEGIGAPQPGRQGRRLSLLYFGQLTDFQLADEESPARVEIADVAGPPLDAAWRPTEALAPHTTDAAIRQVNAFAGRSPVADSSGRRARMEFTLVTGDNADNQQRNETEWVVRLLEGGNLIPNSGIEPAPVYTGVSDYDDYPVPDTSFYDPDSPRGMWSAFPTYPGLLDRAQQGFQAVGLAVPSYVTFGNHDGLVQGNQAANSAFEDVATGALKVFGAGLTATVPADPARQFVDKAQYQQLYTAGTSADGHGFGLVEPGEQTASRGAAGYYAFSPRPGFRFISLDTVCDGGVAGASADGNVDDPQFRWLERQLRAAGERDELIILFSHHAIASLTCSVADEAAGQCTGPDEHGHGHNPGCDLDPRPSGPVHLGADLTDLVHRHPHVIAWVAGHTHANIVEPFPAPGGGFWSIRTASEIDWPQQSRLIEVMDNRDGTLSLVTTVIDHAAPTAIPASGTAATGFDASTLASISRALAANDPQLGDGTGEGRPRDRNVELLVRDPRRNPLVPTGGRDRKPLRFAPRPASGPAPTPGLARGQAAGDPPALPNRTRRGRFDRFCLADGKQVRVAYRRGRAVLDPHVEQALPASAAYGLGRARGRFDGEHAAWAAVSSSRVQGEQRSSSASAPAACARWGWRPAGRPPPARRPDDSCAAAIDRFTTPEGGQSSKRRTSSRSRS